MGAHVILILALPRHVPHANTAPLRVLVLARMVRVALAVEKPCEP